MTGTTPRIRWTSEPEISSAAFAGYVGTFGRDLFRIYAPDQADDRWILASLLPGSDHRSACGGESAEELKPAAERLLSEFVSSLGAVFPADLRTEIKAERDAQDQLAADHEESGHDWQTERAYGRVEALDWMLATLDRIAHRSPSRPTRKRKADR